MPDLFNFSDEMKSYFALLPSAMQLSLSQSNLQMNSTADMRQCVNNLLQNEYAKKEREERHYEKRKNESAKFN